MSPFQLRRYNEITGDPNFRHWCIDPRSLDSEYVGPIQFTWYTQDLTLHTQKVLLADCHAAITVPHKEYR